MRDYSPIDAASEILNDVPEIVLIFSIDGRYLFVNRRAAEFLGADAFDVIGNHWRDLGYPEEIMEPLLSRVEATAASGRHDRYRLTTTPQRGSRVLDVSLTPLEGDSESVYAVLFIAHDITEFVR